MGRGRKANILSFIGNHLLLCVLSIQVAFALAIIAALQIGGPRIPDSPVAATILGSIAAGLIRTAAWTGTSGIRSHCRQRDQTKAVSDLLETVLDTSHEWLWTVDDRGFFTFSSRASARLLGYEPSELVGKPITMVIDQGELASARRSAALFVDEPGSIWSGITVACRHRNGAPVWMEVSGKSRPDRDGTGTHFEGTSRLLPAPTVRTLVKERIAERINSTLHGGTILTAFQPIHEFTTGTITGVEALARFPATMGEARITGSTKPPASDSAGNSNSPPWRPPSSGPPNCHRTCTSRSTSHPRRASTPACRSSWNSRGWPFTGSSSS
jgi:PAS domain S-box-containing protein